MGLFKTPEEKEQAAQDKERKILEKYNLEDLSDPKDIDSIRKIAQSMVGVGMMAAGADIGLGSNEKAMMQVQMHYQRVIMEQNFIMIRQLDRISKLLEK